MPSIRFRLLAVVTLVVPIMVVATTATSDEDKVASEVLLVLNTMRTNPSSFIPAIDRYVTHVRSFTKDPKALTAAAKEIKAILKTQKALEPFNILGMLQLAAQDQAADIAKTGVMGHIGSDGSNPMTRVQKYGKTNTLAECITYGHMTAELIVASFLVDEGTPDRGHRKNLLNSEYTKVGIAVGSHPTYARACVIVLSSTQPSK